MPSVSSRTTTPNRLGPALMWMRRLLPPGSEYPIPRSSSESTSSISPCSSNRGRADAQR